MRKSKVGSLITACIMIMLSTAMVVCGTYALWSSETHVTTHLQAGNLEVTLKRTYLEKYTLDQDENSATYMYMTTTTSSDTVDLTSSTADNVFGLQNEKLVPTTYYAARLELTNTSTIAVDYEIKINVNRESDEDLVKQLKVYVGSGEIGQVTYDGGQYLGSASESNTDYLSFTVQSGVMDKDTHKCEFWIKVEFEAMDNNDAAQNKNAAFDLLVTATQKTTQANSQA